MHGCARSRRRRPSPHPRGACRTPAFARVRARRHRGRRRGGDRDRCRDTARSRPARSPDARARRSFRAAPPPRGAAGYLLKTESPERIAEFLEGVVQGDAALSGPVARRLLAQVRTGTRGSGVPDSIASVLSARELEVLLLLDEHHGTDEIAQRLFISEHTVRSHVKSLLRKLDVSSRREALEQLSIARG